MPPPGNRPAFINERDGLPGEVRSLLPSDWSMLSPHWTMLGDTPVIVAPVADDGRLRLMYLTPTTNGVFDVTVANGAVRAVLRNKSHIEVSRTGTLTWSSAGGDRVFKGALLPLERP
jgi:hypothetical protein